MATDKHPNQNVNVPILKARIEAARARLDPGRSISPLATAPVGGKGSRREIRPGEWIDDRVIDVGSMKASPSKDSPPVIESRTIPATFDPLKVYAVTLSRSVEIDGRWRSPSASYEMVGAVAEANRAAIADAVELGDIPVDPDAAPS